MTFVQLCGRLLGKRMPKLAEEARLEARLSMNKAERDALDLVLRRKGALSLAAELDRFLSVFEVACVGGSAVAGSAGSQKDVTFGGHTLLTTAEKQNLFLHQLRHFPFYTRVQEIRKVVDRRLKNLAESTADAIHRAVNQKLETLLHALPDGEERRARATALLKSRDERLAQLKDAQKAFLKAYDGEWRSMDLLTVYGEFWQDMAARVPDCVPVWDALKPLLKKKRVATDDLPALLWLGERLYGLSRLDIRHVVIDEAQDVSPLQVKVLRKLFNHDAFTLVGDLWQGIYGDEGIRSWDDLCEGVFETAPVIATLSTSYRSTVEIMAFAFRAMARHPVAGVVPGKPVLRHGEAPVFTRVAYEAERNAVVAEIVSSWKGEGFFSMAVIVKREADAKGLHEALVKELPEARLVTRGDDVFEGGVLVMGASLVKGLEFDCVLIADAEEAVYPDERFYAKLFYVLCTRPLHRLRLVGVGEGIGLGEEPQIVIKRMIQ